MTDFLRVDNEEIDLKTALQWRLGIDDDDFVEETVRDVALLSYCKLNQISVSKEEIQNVFDEYRYAKEMESADEIKGWMRDTGIDKNAMAQVCEIMALRNSVRKSISDDQCREVFNLEQTSYEIAEIYRIAVDDKELADEILSQIEDEEESFYNLAVEHSVDDETYLKAGYVGEVNRNAVPAAAESLIFSASDGSIVGPISEGDQHTIYMVREVIKPTFEDLKERIRDDLFSELIEGLPGTVKVEVIPLGTIIEPVEVDEEEGD